MICVANADPCSNVEFHLLACYGGESLNASLSLRAKRRLAADPCSNVEFHLLERYGDESLNASLSMRARRRLAADGGKEFYFAVSR